MRVSNAKQFTHEGIHMGNDVEMKMKSCNKLVVFERVKIFGLHVMRGAYFNVMRQIQFDRSHSEHIKME